MIKSKVYKLKPNKEQLSRLPQIIGNCRFVYNRSLDRKTTHYRETWISLSAFDLMKELTQLKKEHEWLRETPSGSLQHSIVNMETAFKNFFKWSWFPKRKSRNSKQSFHTPSGIKIDYSWNWVFIPKLWWTKFFKDKNHIHWDIRNATISKKADWYYISIAYDIMMPDRIKTWEECGIDLWIKDFVVLSDWEKINNPKYLIWSQDKLRVLQRKLSRQSKGSKRREETKRQISRLHQKIHNQRLDFLHKTSTSIAKRYDACFVEDLNVNGMMKNRCLSKSIADAWWGIFATLLKYKTNVVEIGRFEPSSKLCSHCGNIYWELKLSEREWICSRCWTTHDRDVNAAINIKNLWARALLTDAKTKQ